MINRRTKKIENDKYASKYCELFDISMKINLYSSVCLREGKIKLLVKDYENDRNMRVRPENTQKDSGL